MRKIKSGGISVCIGPMSKRGGPTSLTNNAVIVAVVHILIRRMPARHRRDAVRPRLGAGDTAVVIVVVQLQRVVGVRVGEITNSARTPAPALLLPKYRREGGSGTVALNIRGSRWRWPRLWQRCSAFPAGLRNFRQAVRLPSLCYPIFPTDSLRPAPAMEHPPRARRWRHAPDGQDACTPRSSERRHAKPSCR